MKILGSVTPVRINADVAKSLKLKEGISFVAIPNEVLDRFGAKGFDVIDSDNELMLVAQSAKAELTTKNKPTRLKEIVS